MRINWKYFTLGATLGLIVLLKWHGYLDMPDRKPLNDSKNDWKASYEQICVEDTASKSGCLCALELVGRESPDETLDGEKIYFETKELLKGVCLE